jgi:hypothetical protein
LIFSVVILGRDRFLAKYKFATATNSWEEPMKKLMILVFATVMMSSFAAAQAGNTAAGSLAVTANVTSSINLVFNTSTGGVTLGAPNTSASSLAFGTVQAFGGVLATGVTRTVGASNFTVSSPVDVIVTKANSTSANYTLTAQLAAADATNTWTVGGVTVTSGAAAPVTTNGAYGATTFPVAIQIPLTGPAGSISNTITYTATSN